MKWMQLNYYTLSFISCQLSSSHIVYWEKKFVLCLLYHPLNWYLLSCIVINKRPYGLALLSLLKCHRNDEVIYSPFFHKFRRLIYLFFSFFNVIICADITCNHINRWKVPGIFYFHQRCRYQVCIIEDAEKP